MNYAHLKYYMEKHELIPEGFRITHAGSVRGGLYFVPLAWPYKNNHTHLEDSRLKNFRVLIEFFRLNSGVIKLSERIWSDDPIVGELEKVARDLKAPQPQGHGNNPYPKTISVFAVRTLNRYETTDYANAAKFIRETLKEKPPRWLPDFIARTAELLSEE